MRRLLFVWWALALAAGCGSAGPGTAGDGTEAREGRGRGRGGPVTALVETRDGVIINVEILEHWEDAAVGGQALELLVERTLEAGSLPADAVSGATETSRGFFEAVEDAMGGGP